MLNFYSKVLHTGASVKDFLKTAAEAVEVLATENAEKYGYGRELVVSHGGFWVILKIRFRIEQYPISETDIISETWPLPPGRIKVERQYRLKDSNGRVLLNAVSEWCILGLENRRPLKMEADVFSGGHEYLNEKSDVGDFCRIHHEFTENDFCFEKVICEEDIDINNHTNNKKYTEMVLNCFTDEYLYANPIKTYELHFVKETYLGDKISIFKAIMENKIYITGICNGAAVFNAVLEF